MQLSLLGYTNIRRRVESRVVEFVERFRPRWIYVGFSGGKDSTAVLASAINASPVPVVAVSILVAGLTHPDNSSSILNIWGRICSGCPVKRVVMKQPGRLRWAMREPERHTLYLVMSFSQRYRSDFWRAVELWGLPGPGERTGSGLRWCEADMKNWAWRDLPPSGKYGSRPARFLLVGVRRSESWYRAGRWPSDTPVTIYDENGSGAIDVAMSPIYDLSTADTWSMVREYGLADILVRLYKKWGNNPNCVVCPLRSDKLNERAFRQLPTPMLVRIRASIEKGMKRFKPGTFVYNKSKKWIEIIDRILVERGENK